MFDSPTDAQPFTCALCMEHMNDPRTACSNGHSFCKFCLSTWVTTCQNESHNCCNAPCPTCRADIHFGNDGAPGIPNRNLNDALAKLVVRCPNAKCKWSGQLADLHEHRDTCQFEDIDYPCKALGCKDCRGPRGQCEAHCKKAEKTHALLKETLVIQKLGNMQDTLDTVLGELVNNNFGMRELVRREVGEVLDARHRTPPHRPRRDRDHPYGRERGRWRPPTPIHPAQM